MAYIGSGACNSRSGSRFHSDSMIHSMTQSVDQWDFGASPIDAKNLRRTQSVDQRDPRKHSMDAGEPRTHSMDGKGSMSSPIDSKGPRTFAGVADIKREVLSPSFSALPSSSYQRYWYCIFLYFILWPEVWWLLNCLWPTRLVLDRVLDVWIQL